MNEPAMPPTEETALAWARSASRHPDAVRRLRHAAFDGDETCGGFAFVDGVQLLVVDRRGGWGSHLLDAGPPEEVLDRWLARNRHAARPLSWDDLGPWQRAAVTAVRAGATVAALPPSDRAGLDTELDRDHADWVWVRLRDAAPDRDPLRVLAADDSLMAAPAPAGRHGRRTHPCPLCGYPTLHADRYPRSVCTACAGRATDSAGRRIRGYNTSLTGGFVAHHVDADGAPGDVCDEVTSSGRCRIDRRGCSIGEARFGGVVVQAGDADHPGATPGGSAQGAQPGSGIRST